MRPGGSKQATAALHGALRMRRLPSSATNPASQPAQRLARALGCCSDSSATASEWGPLSTVTGQLSAAMPATPGGASTRTMK